jgi:hypothetical protein
MGINSCYPYVHRLKLHTDISLPTYRDKRETGLLIAKYHVHVHSYHSHQLSIST